jgi:hypothetical protein
MEASEKQRLMVLLRETIAANIVLSRPGRKLPRCRKRRPKNFQLMTSPRHEMRVTPTRRDKRKKCHSDDEADQTPAEKRASMTGFCSCKTGIHAIPGNNLGKTIEARLQY